MAWAQVDLNAEQGSGVVNYYNYRTMRGDVQMRLTDVAIANQARWYSATYFICLIDRDGGVHGDSYITKTWGQQAAFKTIGYVAGSRAIRLQIRASVRSMSGGVEVYNWWSAQLRWNNSTMN